MSRRAKLLGLVALVATGAAIAVPAQASAPIKTDISVDGDVYLGDGFHTIFGTVSSDKRKCVSGRTVRIYADYPDDPKVLRDIAKTGKSGRYAGYGDFAATNGVTVKVARKKIGPRKHRRVCGANSLTAT